MTDRSQPKTGIGFWRYVPAILVTIILIAFAVMLFQPEDKKNALGSVLINKPLLDFSTQTLDENTIEPDKTIVLAINDLKAGRVSIVNFWASWCVPCRIEHPKLMELSQDDTIDLYGMNYKDDVSNAAKFLRKLGNPFIKTGIDKRGRIGFDWGVYGVPETFVIDGKGTIIYRHVGPIQNDDIEVKFLPAIKAAQK